MLFTSLINGNTLFLPAAGDYDGLNASTYEDKGEVLYYWSSEFKARTNWVNSVAACFIATEDFSFWNLYDYDAYYQCSVRPIMKK